MVGTKAVTAVPNGTLKAMLLPVITPVTAGVVKLKAVIALAVLRATLTVTV
jgi:hypothetical protein